MTWPNYDGPGPRKIGMLGDSIAVLVSDEIGYLYTCAPDKFMGAWFGGMCTWQIRDAGWPAQLAATAPDHVVIISGTNDSYIHDAYWGALVVLGAQHDVIQAFPPSTKVHWVNVYQYLPPRTAVSVAYHAQGFNNGLAYWKTVFPNLRVIDWNAAIQYAYGQGVQLLGADGIHPNQAGQDRLRDLIAVSIAAG